MRITDDSATKGCVCERRLRVSSDRCCWVLGSRPAPAPLLKRPTEAHRAVISASRYRYGCSLCPPGAAKPAAKPAAAANSAAMDSNRRAWSVFSWLSTAAATASACGAAEVVNVCRLVCPIRVNPASDVIPGFWSCCAVRSCLSRVLGPAWGVALEPAGRPPP